jgi:hypothetical protein
VERSACPPFLGRPLLFSKACSNVVESAVILMESVAAPHERRAELARCMHDPEHAGDNTA